MPTYLTYLFSTESGREIDNAYHLSQIAETSQQIRDVQMATLQTQIASGVANLTAIQGIALRQDITNAHLQQMAHDLSSMRDLFRLATEKLDYLSHQLLEQQQTLEKIAQTLRTSYEVKAQELRREADKWLISGMKTTGRDRTEDWKDALRLFRITVENPIGRQDYVAWFQLGWLLWKHEQNLSEAEEAFYRAYRLSSQEHNLYYLWSIRHLAYMQYLQGKYEDSYQTIQKALQIDNRFEVLYDAARYAAKTGREQECTALLDRCIDLQPTTIITMFAEADFL